MIDIREMSVLIADDMENMYNSIRGIMRILKFGKKFNYVNNGEDALKALKEGMYDLAMLDNNMPGITGLELIGIIRNDKELRDMPVIMITGHAEQEFITNAAESDIDAYLLKPITVNLLKEKVPQVIEKANNPTPMTQHLRKAAQFAEGGDLDSAIQEAGLAIEANTNSSRPLRDLGEYHMQKGDVQRAEQYLLKAAEMNKIDVIAFNHLGDLYLNQDDIDKAMKYFAKAVAISPRHYERGLNLGKILVRKNMVDKAIPVFNKVFELARDPLAVKEEVANYCVEQDARDYASKLLKGVLEMGPPKADIYYKLGCMCDSDDDKVFYLQEAERLEQNNIDVKMQLARAYISQGMLIRAERPLKDVLKIDPDNQEATKLLRQCI